MNKPRAWMQQISQHLQLPADVTAGIPKMEFLGSTSFSLEPHRGLLEYEKERISLSTSLGTVTVQGEGLTIRTMNRQRITISGHVRSVTLEEGHG